MLTWAGGRVGVFGIRRAIRLFAGVPLGARGRDRARRGFQAGLHRLVLIGVSAATLLGLSTGLAAAQGWTGTTSNDWTVGSNWALGSVPTAVSTANLNTASPNPTVLGVGGPAVGVSSAFITGNAAGTFGNLSIQNGSTLTTTTTARFGLTATSGGTVTVTDPGSQWLIGGSLILGFVGNGTLSIQNGALVTALNTTLGSGASASGTLNLSSGGTFQARFLRAGNGVTTQANFDNGVLRAIANDVTPFINGFSGTELNLLAGGLTIDTAGFAVGTDTTSAFSGLGGLTVTGGGTLSLLANNTYSGETSVQAGNTLSLSGAGAVASSSRVVANGTFNISAVTPTSAAIRSLAGSGNVVLGGKTLDITAANDTFSGVIAGAGGLTISGGTQTLTGANTYTGPTTIQAGTLQLGNGGTSGSIVTDVLNNGTLAFNRSDTLTYGGVISGTGAVNQLGTGTTILTGTNTYGGPTNITAGTLQIGNGGTSGSIAGDVANNATLAFNRSDAITFGGIISGTGAVNQLGAGTTILTGNNTYTGPTTIAAGTLQIGNGGTSGSIVSDVTNNGTLAFSRSDALIYGGVISGIGAVNHVGTGITALTGTHTYTGPTTIAAGTLQIGNGGTSGSIVSDVTNNATLAFNRSDALTYGGIISGTGVVNQVGGGTTILTGTNTYTGATNVQAGTLVINGNQTGATGLTSVFSGARLGGTGIIGGDLTGFAGGIIAPGNSIGTLTVNGNYLSNGATLEVEAMLGGDGSPADLLLIKGDSLLGLAPTLVQVTNVGGMGGITTNGIKIVDVMGATSNAGVFALSGPAIGGAYAYQLFQNDLATGTDGDWYLRNPILAPTTPTFENYPVALLGMTDLPTLRQRVGDRVEAADGVWSRIEGGAGHHQATSSNTGASYDSSLFLAQFGVEGALIDGADGSLVAGISAQYSRNAATVFSSFGNGSNLTEGAGIGATLTWRGADGTYVDLQGQLAKFWTDLDAIGYRLVSDNGGTGLAVSLEAGHEIALDDAWSITPQAQLSYASVGFDSFTDRFGSVISLEAGNSLKGRVGLAVDYRADLPDQDATASINGVASLTYEFLDGATVAVSGTNLHYTAQKFGAELGLGGTLEWNGGAQALHAEVLGSTSFQGSYAVRGTVGFTAGF